VGGGAVVWGGDSGARGGGGIGVGGGSGSVGGLGVDESDSGGRWDKSDAT